MTVVATLGVLSGLGTLASAAEILVMLGVLADAGQTFAGDFLFLGVPSLLSFAVGLLVICGSVAFFRGKRWGRTTLEVLIWGTVVIGGSGLTGILIAGMWGGLGLFATLALAVAIAVVGLGPLCVIGYLLRLERVEAFLRHSR